MEQFEFAAVATDIVGSVRVVGKRPIETLMPQSCPGCGSGAEVKKNGSRWKVVCEQNKTTLSVCQKMGHTMLTRKEAVRVWNVLK